MQRHGYELMQVDLSMYYVCKADDFVGSTLVPVTARELHELLPIETKKEFETKLKDIFERPIGNTRRRS